MRILFVGADFAWPPVTGGRIRVLSQLRALYSLDEVESVRFFSLRETEIPEADRAALAGQSPRLEVLEPVYHPIHIFSDPRYLPRVAWLRTMRGVPYLAGKWESPAVRRALERELTARTFDVIWIGCLGMARYLPLVRRSQPRARVVLDQHDVESEKFAQLTRRQRGVRRLVAQMEWRAARDFERETLRAVDAVGAISEDDALTYRELASVRALTIPQIVPFVRREAAPTPGPRLCYVGNLRWHPNVRGLDWFCRLFNKGFTRAWKLTPSLTSAATFPNSWRTPPRCPY